MCRCKQAKAVGELLEKNAAIDYLSDLEELWESWLTNDENQNVPKKEVREKLFRYKAAHQFFKELVNIKSVSCS